MRVRRWQTVALGIALTPAVVGIADVAWSATTSGPVTACYSAHGGPVVVPKPGKHCGANTRKVTIGDTATGGGAPAAFTITLTNTTVNEVTAGGGSPTNIGSMGLDAGTYLVEAQFWAQQNQFQINSDSMASTMTCYLVGGDSESQRKLKLADLDDFGSLSVQDTVTLNEDGGVGLTCFTNNRQVDVHDIRMTAVQLSSVTDETPPDNG